jgi:hypothetical protein
VEGLQKVRLHEGHARAGPAQAANRAGTRAGSRRRRRAALGHGGVLIRRPIVAIVISIMIVLVGLFASRA